MISQQIGDVSSSTSILGRSTLQQQMSKEIQAVVPDLIQQAVDVIDEAIQSALDKVVDEGGDITYEPKPLNEVANNRPNTGNVNFNNFRLENLASVPDLTSITSILATPSTACNVSTTSALVTLNLALNTAYCGPLFSTMDCKDKRLTGVSDLIKMDVNDSQTTAQDKVKQAVNYGSLNQIALVRNQEDNFNDFDASILGQNKHITGVDTEVLTNLQMDDFDTGTPSEEVQKLVSQAATVKYALEHTVHAKARDPLDTSVPAQSSCFDSQGVNIQNGREAILDNDYVIKAQTIVEEEKELQFEAVGVVVAGPYDHFAFEDSDTVYTCTDPKSDPTGQLPNFTVKGSVPTQTIAKNKQVANLKYVDAKAEEEAKKRHSKTEDVDLTNTHKVVNMPNPSASHHGVNKSYCDSNSGKDTEGGGSFLSTIFGAIAGGLAGGIAGGLASMASQGLASAIGSVASAGAAAVGAFTASGLFSGGARVGSQAALEGLKANNPIPNEGALIDNLKDDIANRPQGQPDAGSLVSGPMSVSGLFRAVRNAQVGLFDLVP